MQNSQQWWCGEAAIPVIVGNTRGTGVSASRHYSEKVGCPTKRPGKYGQRKSDFLAEKCNVSVTVNRLNVNTITTVQKEYSRRRIVIS